MPIALPDWRFELSASPETFRREAEKWESVANATELDGDIGHAEAARRNAANLRQKARELQVDQDFAS